MRLEREAVPAGRMFFCHHLTPELVWQEGRASRMRTGRSASLGMIIAAEDPAGARRDLFARMFGREAVRRDGERLQPARRAGDGGGGDARRARGPARQRGPDPDGRAQFMAALVLRTTSLDQVWKEVPEAVRFENGLMVPANAACGAALIFRE